MVLDKIIGFLGGGTIQSIERVASEWIQTDKETAEAKTIMVKALDPNGRMRRDLSGRVSFLYSVYILTSLLMILIEFTCALFGFDVNTEAIGTATSKCVELFAPITTLFGTIVTVSFGVNAYNIRKGV